MSKPKSILDEAIEDAKFLKQTAIENAKNVLIEAISPNITKFVESQLGECMTTGDDMNPDMKMMQHMMPKDEAAEEPEAHSDEPQDLEMLKHLGLLGDEGDEGEEKEEGDKDEDEDKEEVEEMNQPYAEGLEMEAKEKDEEGEDEKKVDEVVEITNEDLKEALAEIIGSIQKEAKVTKGFGDVQDPTPKNAGGKGETGLVDEKTGEHPWTDVMAPAAQDFTVKEAKRYIQQLTKENASLKKEANEYKKAYGVLKSKLQEVNLFNSKLLYTQKVFNMSELNSKQRLGVIEAFDRASNMREVELVYRSLSESLKITGALVESKQQKATKARASRFTTPSSTILKEALVKEEREANGEDEYARRMQQLANIL